MWNLRNRTNEQRKSESKKRERERERERETKKQTLKYREHTAGCQMGGGCGNGGMGETGWGLFSRKNVHTDIQSNFICNSPKLETCQIPFSR